MSPPPDCGLFEERRFGESTCMRSFLTPEVSVWSTCFLFDPAQRNEGCDPCDDEEADDDEDCSSLVISSLLQMEDMTMSSLRLSKCEPGSPLL